INRFHRARRAGRDSPGCQLIDLFATPTRKGNHAFRMGLSVADLPLREGPEERLGEEYGLCAVVHDHAGGLAIGETGIERETKLAKELHRPLQIAYGQVNEDRRERMQRSSDRRRSRHRPIPSGEESAAPRSRSHPAVSRPRESWKSTPGIRDVPVR